MGFEQFAQMGSGSLLWLENGAVVKAEVSANSLGVKRIVDCSIALWND
jgi:hypothetical protein